VITVHNDLSIDACATIRGTCPAEYVVGGRLVEFHFGGPQDGFHFAFDGDALRNLMRLGGEALAQLDAVSAGK
jgi:hypothetical protein